MSEEIKKYADPILDATPRIARDPADQEAYDAFFANGGKVSIVDKNARSETFSVNPWQRGKGRPKATPQAKDKK
jgi:hypothetical protein